MKPVANLIASDIHLLHVLVMNASIRTPEPVLADVHEIVVGTASHLAIDVEGKKTQLSLKLLIVAGTDHEAKPTVPTCEFDLRFIFEINRFEEYIQDSKKGLVVSGDLMVSLASIAYSTARGMLISRLQNTVFSRVFLPVLDPNELVKQMEEARDKVSVNA